jgi:hypothetical protein
MNAQEPTGCWMGVTAILAVLGYALGYSRRALRRNRRIGRPPSPRRNYEPMEE